jgi:hypothetical protein
MSSTRARARLRMAARIGLAAIRFFNGSVSLFTPELFAKRLGIDVDRNPAALYTMRMFGIRTILVAVELVWPDAGVRRNAIKNAPIIHMSDLLAALIASRSKAMPRGAGNSIVAISAFNTALALAIQDSESEAKVHLTLAPKPAE